jgi:hypothetical protein
MPDFKHEQRLFGGAPFSVGAVGFQPFPFGPAAELNYGEVRPEAFKNKMFLRQVNKDMSGLRVPRARSRLRDVDNRASRRRVVPCACSAVSARAHRWRECAGAW